MWVQVETPCLHLSPESYQYSWVCRVRLCDDCLISLWFPCARPVRALLRQQHSAVWSAERTAACIDLHTLSLPSAHRSTHTQMLPTGAWIHASTVDWHRARRSDLNTAQLFGMDAGLGVMPHFAAHCLTSFRGIPHSIVWTEETEQNVWR